MENKTGIPVRGTDFFKRDTLVDQAWDLIRRGSNILIAAPRRVGKTSLMFYLMDNPQKDYNFLYLTTESVNNENEFYRRLANKLMKSGLLKTSEKFKNFLKTSFPNITKIGTDGIEFSSKENHNYFEIVSQILKSINSAKIRLVILLDEFPQTLENIIRDEGDKGKDAGIHFLQTSRELRQDPEINSNISFIYAGSIGLENIVSVLNASSTIMDISRLKILPLSQEEAKEFFNLLLHDTLFKIDESLVVKVLEYIKWFIPFYIQLFIEALNTLCRDCHTGSVTEEIIAKAFSSLLEQRNAFEHWHTRLRTSLKTTEYNFSKELLNIASENEIINVNEIINIAIKYKLENEYKDLVNVLVHDGYINNQEKASVYRFNSPILLMWWRQNVAC